MNVFPGFANIDVANDVRVDAEQAPDPCITAAPLVEFEQSEDFNYLALGEFGLRQSASYGGTSLLAIGAGVSCVNYTSLGQS